MIRPHHVTILGYELLVYHLDSGSSAWLNGTCIGRLVKVKDGYREKHSGADPTALDSALEELVRRHTRETAEVERV